MKRLVSLLAGSLFVAVVATPPSLCAADGDKLHEGNWLSWRGPLQTGVSLEDYDDGATFKETPLWVHERSGQGTPVIFGGRIYSWGYEGKGADLQEVLSCHDEKTGEVLWEQRFSDFISDTIYNRYSIGAPAVDPETGNVYLATTYGLFVCLNAEGEKLWEHSMIERFGRLTFPNGRAGAPIVDGDLVIIRGVTSYWGKDGPARDRFFGFDKRSGDLVWSSTPGVGPPYLKDTSMSTPYLETRDGKRVMYAGTGCGNIVCINVHDGTPLWRYQISKGGVNSSPVILGDELICIHGKENLDTTEMGRMFAIQLPKDFDNPGGEVDETQGGAPRLPADVELWRNPLEMFTSSPLLHDGRVYQMVKTGSLYCLDAETGKTLWDLKLSNSQLHASPAFVDGMLIVPVYEGSLFVIKPGDEAGEIVAELELEGNCIGSPAICNGRVYVHTTEKLYCFPIEHSSITWAPLPEQSQPEAAAPAKLLAAPSDVLLTPGNSVEIQLKSTDANGNVVGEAGKAAWEGFIPPTAKVKASMDAAFSDGNILAAADGAKESAGMFKATVDGKSGFVRGRVVPNLPMKADFEGAELGGTSATNGQPFAFPPLAWIGGRFKWEIQELDGNKVLMKTLDRILFQRSTTFIGSPELSNYTYQADLMTDGNRRVKSVVGLVNQRYIISLIGNANLLEVSSNHERVKESVPFPIQANKWYTLKTRVDVAEDGSGVIRAKAWAKGEAEPEAWTIEVEHKLAHRKGSPGLFGFSPQSQKAVFVDNISIEAN